MPRDSNGIYSLPPGYLAVTGEIIQPSQHNPPLEDIASALTGSLPRSGSAPMGGPVRLVDGTLSAPAVAFNSALSTGFMKTANGIGFVIAGVLAAEIGASGFVSGVPIGAGADFWGTTAPSGWIFPYGQAISRTTYAALFAVLGTTYGSGDGSTTFNLPDKRDRASFGKGNMGGTAANRITNQSGGWEGDTLGAAGGAQTHTLAIGELAEHFHNGSTGQSGTLSGNTATIKAFGVTLGTGATGYGLGAGSDVNIGVSIPTHNHSVSISSTGSSVAHNNLPPGIVCNYIIYAGV